MLWLIITIGFSLFFVSYRIFGKVFNPFFVMAFPVYFSLYGGNIVRNLSYPVEQNLYTDTIILVYLISIFIGSILGFYTLKAMFKNHGNIDTLDLVVNEKFYPYLLIIVLACVAMLYTEFIKYPFSFNGFRQFYHESRATSGMGLYFYLLGISIPILVLLSFRKDRTILALIFFISMIFIGKKQGFLTAAMMVLAYIDLCTVRRTSGYVIPILLFIVFILTIQVFFSSADLPILQLISGYFDYYINLSYTLEWLSDNNYKFNGAILLTSLWFFLPRSLYPDKPELYGTVLIHEQIYPDFLALGYTPGIFSPIAAPMADFGIWFLIVATIIKSAGIAALYFYFLRSRLFVIFLLYVSIFDLMYILLFLPIIFLFTRRRGY